MRKTVIIILILFHYVDGYSQSVNDFLKKGIQQYDANDFTAAAKTFRDGLKVHPNEARLNFRAGLTYLSLPNKAESLRYLQAAFSINPGVDNNLYYYLGLSYQSNRQYVKALEFFEEAKKRNKKIAPQIDKKIRQSQFADSLTQIPSNVVVENVGKAINSSFHEYSPLVSADGNTMIFTSNRPDPNVKVTPLKLYEDIYISKKVDGQWSKPTKISPNINIQFNDAAASLSGDGKTLILYYEYGGGDIYISKAVGDEWTKPIPLNKNINNPVSWETSAFLTADGQKLYFTSDRPGGMGHLDIYVSEMEKTGDWGNATNLGPVINTPGREDSPAVDPDGSTLYFSSDGHEGMGGMDIFKSEFKDGQWQKPVNMGYPINSVEDDSFFAISTDKRSAYFSTLREEGNAEIYTLTFIEPDQEIAHVVKGNFLSTPQKYESPQETLADSKKELEASREDFASTLQKTRPVVSGPASSVNSIVVGSRKFLFFSIGKEVLNAESVSKLKNVYSLLQENAKVKLLIDGHTDDTGSYLLNKALSVKRANSVAKYLVSSGVEPSRLRVRAYGSTRPLVSNDDERDGRAINRRVEVRFVN